MRAVQVIAPGQAIFVETPKPILQPGHALVRIQQVSLCGSDIQMLHHYPPERYPLPPGTSGHEVVGVVEAVDAPGSGIQPGDLALTLVTGHRGMAEYYLAPAEHVLPLPPGKPLDHLLQGQQLGTVIYAAKRLPSLLDKDVAVIGQGSAGLWWNFIVRRLGARRVIALDLQAHRLALSAHYGATHTIHNHGTDGSQAVAALTDGRMVDIVIEAAGEADSVNLAIDLARKHGYVMYFGVPRMRTLDFAFERLFWKCLQTQAIVGAMEDPNQACTRLALAWIAEGIADPGPMITHHIPFDQVFAAYELQNTRDEGAVKIVVDLPG
jgi:threonine dehydrogenase-like Zn-dependent dehydrogenase